MTIAYYDGGVRVVDLTSLVSVSLGKTGMGMKEVGSFRFLDSNTWAVKAPFADRQGFHLHGNDPQRLRAAAASSPGGLRVLRLPAAAARTRLTGSVGSPTRVPASREV